MTPFTAAVVAAMLAWTPPLEHAYTGETGLDTIARYWGIARTVAEVSRTEEPLPGLSREETALLLASVGSFESGGWRRDVEACDVGGDGSHSWTLWGLWGDRDKVCADPDLAARVALDRLRSSMTACVRLPVAERLAQYASGRCDGGHRESRHRWARFRAWVAAHPTSGGAS